MAYFISDTVDSLELSAFNVRYEGDGLRNDPYDPAMLLKVLSYAHANGVFISLQIARKLEADLAFRVLGANKYPDHRTFRRSGQQHLKNF